MKKTSTELQATLRGKLLIVGSGGGGGGLINGGMVVWKCRDFLGGNFETQLSEGVKHV